MVVEPLGDTEFLVLLESRQEADPATVAAALPRLTTAQQQQLNAHEQLGISLYTCACHSEGFAGLNWRSTSGGWDCARLLAVEAQAEAWGASPMLHAYAEVQRERLATAILPTTLAAR